MPSTFLTPADLLARGLDLPPLPQPPLELPAGTTCAITGQPIRHGYRVADLTTDATTEFLDAFRGGVDGYVSESAARCFRSANPRAGNPCARSHLAFADGTYYAPLIARESALAQGRPCWSELVRAVWPARAGEQCLVLLTTDTKKRLWPYARVGALGPRTPVYLYDAASGEAGVTWVDWAALLACLDLVEEVYSQGFPKSALRRGLPSAPAACLRAGLGAARRWERALAPWRERAELRLAVLIAQRAPGAAGAGLEEPGADGEGDGGVRDGGERDRLVRGGGQPRLL